MKNDKKNYDYIDGKESFPTNQHQHREAVMEQEQGWFSTEEGFTDKEPEKWPIVRTERSVPKITWPKDKENIFVESTKAGVILKDKHGEITGFLILWEELLGYDNLLRWVLFVSDQNWSGKETIRDLIEVGVAYYDFHCQNPYG